MSMNVTEDSWEWMISELNREYEEEAERNAKASFFYDEDDAIRRCYRKRDWHKNKGKRRIRDGYKVRYV